MEISFGVPKSVTVPLPLAPALPQICPCTNWLQPCSPPEHPRVGGSPLACSQPSGGPCEGGSAPTELLHPTGRLHTCTGGVVRVQGPVCVHTFLKGGGVHSFVGTCTLVCMRRSMQSCAWMCTGMGVHASAFARVYKCSCIYAGFASLHVCVHVCACVCVPFARLSVHTRVHEFVCACTRGCNRAWVGAPRWESLPRGISCT